MEVRELREEFAFLWFFTEQSTGHHGGSNPKQDERRERQRLRKEARLKEWHDPAWKKEFLRFEAQLKQLGLQLKDMTGDGNCLFRSVSDQINDGPEKHGQVRAECVSYLREHSDRFAPFVFDQTYDEYCRIMAENGEWGGNMELQAMSLGYRCNIVIHVLDNPRLEIVNFPTHSQTIHLAYHNGEHYSSVRPRDGLKLPSVSQGEEPQFVAKEKHAPTGKGKSKHVGAVSDEVSLVMAATDCGDVEMVKQTLVEHLYNVESAIDYILLLQETQDSHSMVKVEHFDHEEALEESVEEEEGSYVAPDYHGYSKKKNSGHRHHQTANDGKQRLAEAILMLEGRKLSNKQRKELNRMKTEARKKGVNVEDYEISRGGGKGSAGSRNRTVESGANDNNADNDDEAEIDALLAQVKNMGALKI